MASQRSKSASNIGDSSRSCRAAGCCSGVVRLPRSSARQRRREEIDGRSIERSSSRIALMSTITLSRVSKSAQFSPVAAPACVSAATTRRMVRAPVARLQWAGTTRCAAVARAVHRRAQVHGPHARLARASCPMSTAEPRRSATDARTPHGVERRAEGWMRDARSRRSSACSRPRRRRPRDESPSPGFACRWPRARSPPRPPPPIRSKSLRGCARGSTGCAFCRGCERRTRW